MSGQDNHQSKLLATKIVRRNCQEVFQVKIRIDPHHRF